MSSFGRFLFQLDTNVEVTDEQAEVLYEKIPSIVAAKMKKEVEQVTFKINDKQRLLVGDSAREPAAIGMIYGDHVRPGENENKFISMEVSAILESELGIPLTRYIGYSGKLDFTYKYIPPKKASF